MPVRDPHQPLGRDRLAPEETYGASAFRGGHQLDVHALIFQVADDVGKSLRSSLRQSLDGSAAREIFSDYSLSLMPRIHSCRFQTFIFETREVEQWSILSRLNDLSPVFRTRWSRKSRSRPGARLLKKEAPAAALKAINMTEALQPPAARTKESAPLIGPQPGSSTALALN